MEQQAQLQEALRRLSDDIRSLVKLAKRESDENWDKMIETVRKELRDKGAEESGQDVMHRALIDDIYEQLKTFIKSLKTSQERLKHLATRDLLTGLYNRSYFNEAIAHDIQRAIRNNERLSFIVIDIDNFKAINDTYGHLHGDGILRACAEILRHSVRKSDFVCRYGGDEFVVVTPAETCQDNEALYRRMQDNLDDWNNEYATHDYMLSLSFGCAEWDATKDLMEVLHEADLNMYKHKQQKKNIS